MANRNISCLINVCQNNGKLLLLVNDTTTISYCLCNRCFTGNQCEIEKYSKNLWIYGISKENAKYYNPYNETIILAILGIISFISNLLSLQTFLFSKKIRITNLGIYLILYSLTGLIISIIQSVFSLMNLISNFKEVSKVNHLIQCAFIRLFVNSLNFCLYWLWLYIAAERVFIQYSFVSLYDSRRRSFISSILLFIFLPLSNLLPILFGRKGYSYNSYDFCVLNFTSIGYKFYLIFLYINYIASPLSFSIACVFIFKHLVEHRTNLVNSESIRSSLALIASKHYDFFLPPLVYTLLSSPHFILDKSMNCLRADSVAVSSAKTITQLLGNYALALTFFIYVYLSNVCFNEFCQTSPVGRFLIYVEKRFINLKKQRLLSVFFINK
ncbi:hypothetical protein I4U23_022284 [Adineta vaga]|nr:hypothetical protein I4U23_022284 [Adineta vaga]